MSQSVTTLVWDVSTESVVHQITVPVKLDGKDPTATFVFLYQAAITGLVKMLLTATVRLVGKELSVTSPPAKIAPMGSASHPMNVSAQMGGLVKIVMHAHLELDVNMELAEIIPTLVSVNKAGRDFSVINLPAVWIVTMEFVTLLVKLIQQAFVCANQGGKDQAVTFADLTGDVQIRMLMLVTIPMNVSASIMRLMIWVFATTQP